MDNEHNVNGTPLDSETDRAEPELDTGAMPTQSAAPAGEDAAPESLVPDITMELDEPLEEQPKKRNPIARFFGAIGHWITHHKLIIFILILLVVGGTVALRYYQSTQTSAGATYSFIRTTTLQRTTLQDSVSATGTVESANVSTVTTTKTYAVESVNVQVGDSVAAGDVIAVLDTSDLEEQITRKQESIAKQQEQLEKSNKNLYQTYTDAVDDYNTAVEDLNEAQSDYDEANAELEEADDHLDSAEDRISAFTDEANDAERAMKDALSAYNDKKAEVDAAASVTSAYDSAKAAVEQAQNALTQAQDEQTSAQAAYDDDPSETNALALDNAKAAVSNAEDALDRANDNLSEAEAAVNSLSEAEKELAALKTIYDNAVAANDTAQSNLTKAQNETDYTSRKSTYDSCKTALEQAETALENAKDKVTSAQKSVDRAYENYQDGSSNNTLDELEEDLADLQQDLADCTLVAETSGTVTSLNATVGSSCTGTVATIQDTETLKIAITLEESDVPNVSIGMTCLITSDATDDTIYGTLTQVDPTSTSGATTSTGTSSGSAAGGTTSSSSTFGAEVTVQNGSNGLLIGMNASVEIIQSSTDNVFVVPYNAVGTNEDGSNYVLVQTGGEGVNATFEKVSVTTGASNDYYIEISGSELSEGDVVRSTADESQGVETTDDAMVAGAMGANVAVEGGGGGGPQGGGGGGAPAGGGPGGM